MHLAAWTLMGILLCSAIAVCGCSFLYKDPEVSVQGVNLTSASLSSITLDVSLLVTNPNPFGVTLKNLSFDVYYQNGKDWEYLSHGEKDGLQIKPGENGVTIPVTIDNAQLLRSIAGFFITGKLPLRIEGTAEPDLLIVSPKVPFSRAITLTR